LNVEGLLNRIRGRPAAPVSVAARRLHFSSTVVDLHADSLLWGRDLLARSTIGHVDLPRLREGGVALQVLTAVTRVPAATNLHRTPAGGPDLIAMLGRASGWPEPALRSLRQRVLHQARRLGDLVTRSGGKLCLVRNGDDLDSLLAARTRDSAVVGALFGVEGAHALEGDLAALDSFHAAGVRLLGLAHFFDNEFSGSAHGMRKAGLTELGRELVRQCERRGIVVDLAHASPAAIDDVLGIATRPPIVSHTGVQATSPSVRNLSDAQIRAVAAAGGVVGIGFWKTAAGGRSAADVVRSIRHVIGTAGDDHVALGSDFDGAVAVPFDAAGLPALTEEMIGAGIGDESIQKILGGNALRVLRAVLPER
jgi:microsomal dipeptidase-like Zn-dependent dipeptidase